VFKWGNLRERDHLGDPGVDERMELQEVGYGGVDWIKLAQVRDRSWTLGECGNEPWGTINAGNFLTI
jgi:hypothetical protein